MWARSGIGAADFDFNAVKVCREWRVGFADSYDEVDWGKAVSDLFGDAVGDRLDELTGFAIGNFGHQRIDLGVVDGCINIVVPSGTGEITTEFEIDLVVLTERIFFRKDPVISEEAHIAQAQNVIGHQKNIETIWLMGNGRSGHILLIEGG